MVLSCLRRRRQFCWWVGLEITEQVRQSGIGEVIPVEWLMNVVVYGVVQARLYQNLRNNLQKQETNKLKIIQMPINLYIYNLNKKGIRVIYNTVHSLQLTPQSPFSLTDVNQKQSQLKLSTALGSLGLGNG